MIFSIRDLSFELGSVLLEGWPAFAARALSLIHISEPTRLRQLSRMPSSA